MAQGVKSSMFNIANYRQKEKEKKAKPNIHFFANCMQKQEEGKPNVHVFANWM